MQKPDVVLNNLSKHAKDENYKYEKLYKYLYNPEFYLRAYGKIYSKEGNMTAGTDNETIDGFSMEKINKIIDSMKDLSYKPKPAKRVYIDKKNGGKRPLGIPSFMDKLVQEIVREMLEAIYEPNFSEMSHGYRPEKSCHTALISLKTKCTGMKWWIEGDIKGFFDNINHQTLIAILRKKIKDERFINLIWKFLKAGYMDDWKFNNTYSGTPQGGIISPILANVYLNELDKFIESLMKEFNKGKSRSINKEYKRFDTKIYKLKKRLEPKWESFSQEEKDKYLKEIKGYKSEMRKLSSKDPMDSNFKRMQYVRYADDFIVAIAGSKDEAKIIKEQIRLFLLQKLDLELSEEKTKITNTRNKARFLGFDVFINNDNNTFKKMSDGRIARNLNGHVLLSMPFETIRNHVIKSGYVKEICNKGKKNELKPIHRVSLIHNDDLEIISTYNAEIRGLYEYYKIAYDVSRLSGFNNLAKRSCLKTLASKYKTTGAKILSNKVKGKKFTLNGEFGVFYKTVKGTVFRKYYNDGFKYHKEKVKYNKNTDNLPKIEMYICNRTSLEQRLLANICEYCGKDHGSMEVHHIKKLKDLKGKKKWEKHMIARKRKTLVLCDECHDKLHAGKLD